MTGQPKTPIHDALSDEKIKTIIAFINWLEDNGYKICEVEREEDWEVAVDYRWNPVNGNIMRLIIASFGFTYDDFMKEKDAVLKYIRDNWKEE